MTVRLNININDETRDALQDLAARRQTSVTEVVRRAVSVYKFVEDEIVDGDSDLVIREPNGRYRELRVLA
jgi:predicted transcriptional regulator